MVEKHRQSLQMLLERSIRNGDRPANIECKHFFSGAAAYVEGRIFMTLTSVGLAMKLPIQRRAALLKQGARPLRYFPNAPIKKDYVILPADLVENGQAFTTLLRESLRYSHRSDKSRPPRRR